MEPHAYSPPARWLLISMRPAGQHAPMRRAATRLGARVLALSPWRLIQHDDLDTRSQLCSALAADRVIFTSPAAVAAAARLTPLAPPHPGQWMAVGKGTADALQRAGGGAVMCPERMDSEGLLALPALQQLHGRSVGLVTAPGGRGMIAQHVQQHGAHLLRANVYARQPQRLTAADLHRLRAAAGLPGVLALSSAEALDLIWPQLPADVQQQWKHRPVVCASQRLLELARQTGLVNAHRAAGPQPAQLAEAAAAVVRRS